MFIWLILKNSVFSMYEDLLDFLVHVGPQMEHVGSKSEKRARNLTIQLHTVYTHFLL